MQFSFSAFSFQVTQPLVNDETDSIKYKKNIHSPPKPAHSIAEIVEKLIEEHLTQEQIEVLTQDDFLINAHTRNEQIIFFSVVAPEVYYIHPTSAIIGRIFNLTAGSARAKISRLKKDLKPNGRPRNLN